MGRGADQTIMSDRTDETVSARVRNLIQQGYEQTSRKYRHLARLPEGMNGLDALRRLDPTLVSRWEENLEKMAADHYRRIYSKQVTLTIEEFTEYRKQLDALCPATGMCEHSEGRP